jgi:hypothetical protein
VGVGNSVGLGTGAQRKISPTPLQELQVPRRYGVLGTRDMMCQGDYAQEGSMEYLRAKFYENATPRNVCSFCHAPVIPFTSAQDVSVVSSTKVPSTVLP